MRKLSYFALVFFSLLMGFGLAIFKASTTAILQEAAFIITILGVSQVLILSVLILKDAS